MPFNTQLLLIFSVIFSYASHIPHINANKIELHTRTDYGTNDKYYRCQFPFAIDGTQYFYGQSESGNSWFIRELNSDGMMGNETHKGHFNEFYAIQFPFSIDGKQYFYGQNKEEKNWFIRELKADGKMCEKTDNGRFFKFYDIQFPFSIDDGQYFYGQSKSGNNWFIQELKSGGKMGKETDRGRFGKYYAMQFPFSINGKQYFYGQSEGANNWFIQGLKSGGKMGSEADNGVFRHFFETQFPFSYGGHLFFYGESKHERKWFIQKLLPNGKMGDEENNGTMSSFYRTQFVYSINDQQFVYRQNSDTKIWSIVEVYLCKGSATSLSRRHFTDYRLASWNMQGINSEESKWTNVASEVRNTDNEEENEFKLDVIALQESGSYPTSSQLFEHISPSPITYIGTRDNGDEFNLTQRLWPLGTTLRPDNLYIYHIGNGRSNTSMAIIARRRADEVFLVGCMNHSDRPIIGIRLGFDYFFNIHASVHRHNEAPEAITVIEQYMGQKLRTYPFVTWVIVGDYNMHPNEMRKHLPTPPFNVYRREVVPSNPGHYGISRDGIHNFAITGRSVSNKGELVPQANELTSSDDAVITFIALVVQPLRNCQSRLNQ